VFKNFLTKSIVISGFLPYWVGHTFGFIRCWLQPLSHFVKTNIRKFFQTCKYFLFF